MQFLNYLLLAMSTLSMAEAKGKNDMQCSTSGVISLIIEGINSSTLSDIGKNQANFFLGSHEAKSKSTVKLMQKAYKAGHTVGYRTLKANDSKFHKLEAEDLKAELKEATKKFKELAGIELEYVLLPHSKHDLSEQMEIIFNAGLTPVFPSHGAKNSKANNAMSKKDNGYIIYQKAGDKSATKEVLKAAKKESLKLVSLDKCLDDKADGKKEKKGHKKQAKNGLVRASEIEGHEKKSHKKGKKGDNKADSANPDNVVELTEQQKKDAEADKLKKEAEALAAKQGKKNSAVRVGGSILLSVAATSIAALLI